ncbi:MAG: MFS transporter [Candidatus Heimdallarchaeota archaeon]|nr:MFS transporter [Candidatus Heimdallarchaeota archaeon]
MLPVKPIESGLKFAMMKYLQSDKLPELAQSLVFRYFFLLVISKSLFYLTSAFFVIYILDIVGFVKFATLMTILFVAQALVDYPTGALADEIGQKGVLVIAFILHALAMFMLPFHTMLSEDIQFYYFILIMLIEAVGLSQESGAVQSWFDNNYKFILFEQEEDVDREYALDTYKVIFGKAFLANRGLSGTMILIGGFLAAALTESLVLFIQGFLFLLMALAFYIYIEDWYSKNRGKISLTGFFRGLDDGFKLIFTSRALFFFVLTFIAINVANTVWVSILLDQFLAGYVDSGDAGQLGTLKSILFTIGSVVSVLAVIISTKMNLKFLPYVVILYSIASYGVYAFMGEYYEPGQGLQMEAVILILITGAVAQLLQIIWILLFQRIQIQIVPSENRGAFYSLIPTLALLGSAVSLQAVNFFITDGNVQDTILYFLFIPTIVAAGFLWISLFGFDDYDKELSPVDVQLAVANAVNNMAGMTAISKRAAVPQDWKFAALHKRAWKKLEDVAGKDGVLDRDEEAILSVIAAELKKYGALLEKVTKDEMIDDAEKEQLIAAREKLLSEAKLMAHQDKNISEDEQAIIDELYKIVEEIEQFEKSLQ